MNKQNQPDGQENQFSFRHKKWGVYDLCVNDYIYYHCDGDVDVDVDDSLIISTNHNQLTKHLV